MPHRRGEAAIDRIASPLTEDESSLGETIPSLPVRAAETDELDRRAETLP
jgi:hypothetical protein